MRFCCLFVSYSTEQLLHWSPSNWQKKLQKRNNDQANKHDFSRFIMTQAFFTIIFYFATCVLLIKNFSLCFFSFVFGGVWFFFVRLWTINNYDKLCVYVSFYGGKTKICRTNVWLKSNEGNQLLKKNNKRKKIETKTKTRFFVCFYICWAQNVQANYLIN